MDGGVGEEWAWTLTPGSDAVAGDNEGSAICGNGALKEGRLEFVSRSGGCCIRFWAVGLAVPGPAGDLSSGTTVAVGGEVLSLNVRAHGVCEAQRGRRSKTLTNDGQLAMRCHY